MYVETVDCSLASIAKAAAIVKRAGVVAFPTDTVYGIGCDPYDQSAAERVNRIKGRSGKPLPVLCESLDKAKKIADFGEIGHHLISRFWPGPLTIVAPLIDTDIVRDVTCGSSKIGLRMPNHGCALSLISECGGFLVGTSANRTGLDASRTAGSVSQSLGELIDLLIDGGDTPLGVDSTVIELLSDGIRVLREGYIGRKVFEDFIVRSG